MKHFLVLYTCTEQIKHLFYILEINVFSISILHLRQQQDTLPLAVYYNTFPLYIITPVNHFDV